MSLSVVPSAQHHIDSSFRTDVSQQIGSHDVERTPRSSRVSLKSSPKPRSLSDAPKPTLSPSPAFREPLRRISKDDTSLTNTEPLTPIRRPSTALSLQVPKDRPGTSPASPMARVPLSPKLETSEIYGSPSSMLPRRSRGLDFARACTNLHHSTLAESSPDASPITSRGIQIPQRRSIVNNTVLDSPSNLTHAMWPSMPGERTTLSSSVSSINMLDSGSESDSSSDGMAVDREGDDPMIDTPAANKLNNAFIGTVNSPGMEWLNGHPSPAQTSLMHFQPHLMSFRKARMRKGKSHNSSSSVSMHSSKPSPGPLSPPILKSIESSGYFGPGMTRRQVQSRRESLSLGTDDLHLSDSEDADPKSTADNADRPRVIKRAVTRRSNLLPKTKGFARIRAALLEEAAPIESETRREAEVIRQVHESEPATAIKSPILQPPTPFTQEPVETSVEDGTLSQEISNETGSSVSGQSFSQHAEKHSAGLGFWTAFTERYRTPPPSFQARESSSAMSDDVFDTPGSSLWGNGDNPALRHLQRSRSRSTTPLAQGPPTAAEVTRMVNKKRRRDDDFDPAMMKRRAVSPGMSVQSSPVIPQSPVMMNDKAWGKPPAKSADRSNSGGSISGGSHKKIGLQGMTETSDGFMSMSID